MITHIMNVLYLKCDFVIPKQWPFFTKYVHENACAKFLFRLNSLRFLWNAVGVAILLKSLIYIHCFLGKIARILYCLHLCSVEENCFCCVLLVGCLSTTTVASNTTPLTVNCQCRHTTHQIYIIVTIGHHSPASASTRMLRANRRRIVRRDDNVGGHLSSASREGKN